MLGAKSWLSYLIDTLRAKATQILGSSSPLIVVGFPSTPEVVLSPSILLSFQKACSGMPYPTVQSLKSDFSGTGCLKILHAQTFLCETPYLHFSRCVAFRLLGFVKVRLTTLSCYTLNRISSLELWQGLKDYIKSLPDGE